jgi:CubicO group peptidase (beta-lactamase class C family)
MNSPKTSNRTATAGRPLASRRSFLTQLTATCIVAASASRLSLAELLTTPLQRRVKTQLDLGIGNELTVGAVVMVVQRGHLLARESGGYADLASKRPMPTDAIFDIRSISKPITVFGALLLVQQGKIGLDAHLADYLPQFTRMNVKGQTAPVDVPITIRQLMTHTSGMAQDGPSDTTNITRTFDRTLPEYVDIIARQPLEFVPGTKWSYSSLGIATLGRVIEVASGMAFEDFMRHRVFAPLDMRDSSFFTNRAKVDRIPTMYNLENGHLVKDVMDVTRRGQKYPAPEFGMFSTAEDLCHFAQMMLDRGTWKGRSILPSNLIDEMTRPEMLTSVSKYHCGLGWAIHTGRGEGEMSYAVSDGSYGANGASSCLLWIDPSVQLIRIYLTHYFGGGQFLDGNPVMNAAFPDC